MCNGIEHEFLNRALWTLVPDLLSLTKYLVDFGEVT